MWLSMPSRVVLRPCRGVQLSVDLHCSRCRASWWLAEKLWWLHDLCTHAELLYAWSWSVVVAVKIITT